MQRLREQGLGAKVVSREYHKKQWNYEHNEENMQISRNHEWCEWAGRHQVTAELDISSLWVMNIVKKDFDRREAAQIVNDATPQKWQEHSNALVHRLITEPLWVSWQQSLLKQLA